MTDAELAQRTLAGYEDAFRALVARHQRAVYNLLARMLRNPALAEELAQETFLRAFRHLRSFDPKYKFSNWLFRIAHNCAIDSIRRRSPQEVPIDARDAEDRRVDEVAVDPASDNAVQRLERQDLQRILSAALDRLRPEYRQAVVLRYQEDLGYEEIAAIMELPVGTVKSHLHRARTEMAGYLRRRGVVGAA